MKFSVDSAYPPSLNQAKTIIANGWDIYGGYIGGPRAAHRWTNSDFGLVAQAGFSFIPIFVGRTVPYDSMAQLTWQKGYDEGLQADDLMGQCGFNEIQPCCLDAEAGDYEENNRAYTDYCDGWCEAVHGAGHPTILYSDALTIEEIGSHFDATWLASYYTTGRSIVHTMQVPHWVDPATPPASDGWQFANQGRIAGWTVDLSTWLDSFVPAEYTPPA